MTIERDPNYDWIPPIEQGKRLHFASRGVQCGECGMKFDYGKNYGYACSRLRCPRNVTTSTLPR